jgi:hypothetical protein
MKRRSSSRFSAVRRHGRSLRVRSSPGDGAPGLDMAIAVVWDGVPVQRYVGVGTVLRDVGGPTYTALNFPRTSLRHRRRRCPTGQISSTTASSRARSRPTCRCRRRPSIKWSSTSRPAKTLRLTIPPDVLALADEACRTVEWSVAAHEIVPAQLGPRRWIYRPSAWVSFFPHGRPEPALVCSGTPQEDIGNCFFEMARTTGQIILRHPVRNAVVTHKVSH